MAESRISKGDPAPEAVLRLAMARDGDTFLSAHHVEAARRLARLFDRARLRQRVTMSYDPTRVGSARNRPVQGDIADSAVEARRLLGDLARRLPMDCWGVVGDVCGFDKGLQLIETERGWPRRGAKLVLRIGLEQVAGFFGLQDAAEGRSSGKVRSWLPERPPMFADEV